jgi:hypothetical protein
MKYDGLKDNFLMFNLMYMVLGSSFSVLVPRSFLCRLLYFIVIASPA